MINRLGGTVFPAHPGAAGRGRGANAGDAFAAVLDRAVAPDLPSVPDLAVTPAPEFDTASTSLQIPMPVPVPLASDDATLDQSCVVAIPTPMPEPATCASPSLPTPISPNDTLQRHDPRAAAPTIDPGIGNALPVPSPPVARPITDSVAVIVDPMPSVDHLAAAPTVELDAASALPAASHSVVAPTGKFETEVAPRAASFDVDPASREMDERVRPVTTGDQAELLAMPWQLLAHDGLSYSRAVSADAQTIEPGRASAMAAETPFDMTFRPSAPAESVRISTTVDFDAESSGLVAWSKLPRPAPTSESLQSVSESDLPGYIPSGSLWSQRLLRWQDDGETGGTTAWIRDYTLDAAQARPLIASLRDLAGQQGLSLRRIMLNGHELWRSPSTL